LSPYSDDLTIKSDYVILKWIATVQSAFYKKKGNKSFAYILEYVFKYWTDWSL